MPAAGPAPKRLVISAALAAVLPFALAACLYLLVPAAAPDGASARLTEAGAAAEARPDACREQPRQVTIDGSLVAAYAVLCGEEGMDRFALTEDAPPEPPPPPRAVEAVAAGPAPPAPVHPEPAPKPRHFAEGEPSARYGAGNGAHAEVHHRYRVRQPDPARVVSQQKFGP